MPDGVRYTDAGITPRTNAYAAVEMLSHATPTIVLDKFGMMRRMPKNKTQTIIFRRPRTFDPATVPLQEGVTPNLTQFRYDDVSGTMRQYGEAVEITDIIKDFAEDDVAQDAYVQCGENAGRTHEALDWAVLRAGVNVFYANGASRGAVNSVFTLDKQRAVTRALKANKAKKITMILSGSTDFATVPIEASYIAVAHTDLEPDIRNLPGFTPVANYGSRKPCCPQEIGSVEDVRYVLSEDLDPFEDAGDTASTNNVKSTGGSDADVYPILFFGKEAYGKVALRGANSMEPSIVPVEQKTKDDPLGQRGYIGWKSYHLCMILNELWMARLETATSDL